MAQQTFTIPATGTGPEDDPHRPDYLDEMPAITQWGVVEHGVNSYTVRVQGTRQALDELESRDGVTAE
jgi:hypothetical protein